MAEYIEMSVELNNFIDTIYDKLRKYPIRGNRVQLEAYLSTLPTGAIVIAQDKETAAVKLSFTIEKIGVGANTAVVESIKGHPARHKPITDTEIMRQAFQGLSPEQMKSFLQSSWDHAGLSSYCSNKAEQNSQSNSEKG